MAERRTRRGRGHPWVRWIVLGWIFLILPVQATAARTPVHDSQDFLLGYATGVLERSHALDGFALEFDGSVLVLALIRRPTESLDTIERSLLEIPGVDRIRILIAGNLVVEATPPSPPPTDSSPSDAAASSESPDPSERAEETGKDVAGKYDLLSPYQMFDSLLADPRWPHFSVVHQWYLDESDIGRVGSANFGESFAFVRSPDHDWGQWEVGLQAGVFSVFDLEADSNDLVNSDFLVGLTATHRVGDFTSMLRVYHQSSHLGDEFLLRNRVDRINLSFEVVDLLVSFDPSEWFRLYAGGGVIVHRIPLIDRGIVQTGVEFRSPFAFFGGTVRPIAASDFQFREESDWKLDASVRAGFQVEHPFLRRTQLQVLGEFYSGRSPNGQFYERRIKNLGIGLHLGF
jgi:hypothetical protein